MSNCFKGIIVVVCTIGIDGALAAQPGQSAMNQNGSEQAIARMRHSWKNIGAKPVAAPRARVLRGQSENNVPDATPRRPAAPSLSAAPVGIDPS